MHLPAGYTAQIDDTQVTILDRDKQPIATASVEFHSLAHEHRAYLKENAPDELVELVVAWLEERTLAHFQTLPELPCVMRFDFVDRDPSRYERLGYTFAFAEDQMMRDLSKPIPDVELPEGMQFVVWNDDIGQSFYNVYSAAFRERPGFPGWDEPTWRSAMTGFEAFRPQWSLLVRGSDLRPAGYTLCAEEQEEGWIVQIGVHPDYRRQHLGEALLARAMRLFQASGLKLAMLDVNINNPTATQLYEKMGFTRRSRTYCYRKTIGV